MIDGKKLVKRIFILIVCAVTVIGIWTTAPYIANAAEPVCKLSASLIFYSYKQDKKTAELKSQESDMDETSSIAIPSNAAGKIEEITYSKSSANLTFQNVYIQNKTSEVTLDIEKELKTKPDIKVKMDSSPEVLIYHTHATETFAESDCGYYLSSHKSRTDDTDKNMIGVGETVANELKSAGIGVIHDKTLHDKGNYNGAYDSSLKSMKEYMKKYPSLVIFLDLHRDAITRDNGDIVKPTASINGKKAAQIMIALGSNSGSVTGFDNWHENARFALRLQQTLETDYSGITRPIYLVSKKYNEYVANGSLLIEMGAEGNTIEEAKYSGQLLAKSLAKVCKELK